MSTLDRLTELIARTEGGGEVTATEFGMLLDIRSYTEDLLPLLREWEQACATFDASASLEESCRVYEAMCEAESKLLAALRGASQAVLPGSRPAGEEGKP